jgi:hypothetical protein
MRRAAAGAPPGAAGPSSAVLFAPLFLSSVASPPAGAAELLGAPLVCRAPLRMVSAGVRAETATPALLF